jgi:DNA-binding response OmpR family regulator/ligand-binding sensor domain-containing protein
MLAKWTIQIGLCKLVVSLFMPGLLTNNLCAQPPVLRFTPVEIRDAPPFPLVDCIFQDSRGFMWIGTYGGLYQYDGYTITHYFRNPGDTSGLGDNRVRSIFEDRNGNLWLGTQLGLHFLDVRSGEFKSFTSQKYLIERTIINEIVGDRRGRLWITTGQKIYQVNVDDLKFEEVLFFPNIENSFVRDLAVDARGDLWMTIGEKLLRRDGISDKIEDITPENLVTHIGEIRRILPASDGSIWLVGTKGTGQYHAESRKMIRFISIEELNGNDFLNPSVVLRGDQLIVAGNGIIHVDLSTGKYTRQPVDLEDPDNLAKNQSTSIYLNNQDQLWVGNVSGRPYLCDLSKQYFHFIPLDLFEPIKRVHLLYELFEIWPGHLLLPRSDGLHLLEFRTGQITRFPFKPPFRTVNWEKGVTTFLDEGSNLWMGTASGLFLFDKYRKQLLLQDCYRIAEAADGEAGVRMSLQLVPDLIICDVMMPRMDGFTVCRILHEDDLTTHIPVILLTAKADLTSKVEGLAKGADAYLTKPFLPAELRAQISMLLEQRARLQQIYRQQIKEDVVPMTTAPADPLLSKLYDLLLSQISNEMLDIQLICRRLGVSRSQLHNKIKALTGLSTSIFIRRIRLREARRLIRNTDLNISEIAYSTGFKDPNFFSRVYRKEFGESPREGRG